jgi:hypothetical protein
MPTRFGKWTEQKHARDAIVPVSSATPMVSQLGHSSFMVEMRGVSDKNRKSLSKTVKLSKARRFHASAQFLIIGTRHFERCVHRERCNKL